LGESQVGLGSVNEAESQLQVTVGSSDLTWDDFWWSEAGYVTKYPYNVGAMVGGAQGFEATVNVAELDGVAEMNLLIADHKFTAENPVNASNWYILQKILDTKYYHENLTRVRSRIDGEYFWKLQDSWLSPTGQLKIKVSTGSISFYENGFYVILSRMRLTQANATSTFTPAHGEPIQALIASIISL
jgi:hypothetical protein